MVELTLKCLIWRWCVIFVQNRTMALSDSRPLLLAIYISTWASMPEHFSCYFSPQTRDCLSELFSPRPIILDPNPSWQRCCQAMSITIYSEIPLLRPHKIRTIYLLKTLFWKFKLFFPSFSTLSEHLITDHLLECPKVVFKTTFGQSQRWS